MKNILIIWQLMVLATAPLCVSNAESGVNPEMENRFTKKNSLRLTLHTGIQFDNNVYRYGQEYIETFGQGTKIYRYPSVKSIADALFPMGVRMTANLGQLSTQAGISGELYKLNKQLNNLDWFLSLEWNRPISIRAQFQQMPSHPIRPHSYLPYQYELMSYLKNKVTLSVQLNQLNAKPSIDIALGNYDFNHNFDVYDASFYEGGLGITFGKPIRTQLGCNIGTVLAKPDTTRDWSNIYGSTDADIRYYFGPWVLGIDALIKDAHKGRNDFIGNGSLYVKYRWHGIGITATTGYAWRQTTSPISKVDTRKDYGAFAGGMELSWDLKKKI
jgi:hypothetical protein